MTVYKDMFPYFSNKTLNTFQLNFLRIDIDVYREVTLNFIGTFYIT